jgi:uncharacterized damage-inducible protein DinB
MSTTMRAVEPLITELEQEAGSTRKLLERVPGNKLGWRPHPKSMTLGQLAHHVASMPNISGFVEADGLDVATIAFQNPQPASRDEILRTFEASLEAARTRLSGLDDGAAAESWRLHKAGAELFTIPKIAVLRNLMFNHWYHHRGQLTVYLRLLDVPLPVIYGRTADENPFG